MRFLQSLAIVNRKMCFHSEDALLLPKEQTISKWWREFKRIMVKHLLDKRNISGLWRSAGNVAINNQKRTFKRTILFLMSCNFIFRVENYLKPLLTGSSLVWLFKSTVTFSLRGDVDQNHQNTVMQTVSAASIITIWSSFAFWSETSFKVESIPHLKYTTG